MKIGSLFSGIGGLELGLEWSGLGHTAWQVEQDRNCLHWLAEHWPSAQRHTDVRTVGAHNLSPVDVICGGFPCQDISYAGKGAGLDGHRSGLWYEFARIVGELGPGYVVVENVAALFTRGIDQVLGTLADIGYDAEWSTLRASDVGAPHRRERVFIIAWRRELADTDSGRREQRQPDKRSDAKPCARHVELGHTQSDRRPRWANNVDARRGQCTSRRAVSKLGDTTGERCGETGQCGPDEPAQRLDRPDSSMEHADCGRWGTREELAVQQPEQGREGLGDAERERGCGRSFRQYAGDVDAPSKVVGWRQAVPVRGCDGTARYLPREAAEAGIKSPLWPVAYGVPGRVARLRAVGNAVVPQCSEIVGRRVMEIHANLLRGIAP